MEIDGRRKLKLKVYGGGRLHWPKAGSEERLSIRLIGIDRKTCEWENKL